MTVRLRFTLEEDPRFPPPDSGPAQPVSAPHAPEVPSAAAATVVAPTLSANPPVVAAVAGTLTAASVFAGASDMDIAIAAQAWAAPHLTSPVESIPVFGGTGHSEPPELGFAGRPSDWFFV